MAYIGNQPTDNFVTFATQNFSTSATSSYTLSHAVSNENEIALFINNVRQHPGSGKAYTASGTALTLSANTASTDVMYCIFLGRAIQSTVPATNSITAAMMTSGVSNGVTEADQWRITTDITSNVEPIASNLERVDDASFSKIGTGMSVSSGTWTFPSTGLYLIKFKMYGDAVPDDNVVGIIQATTNNSDYDETSYGIFSGDGGTVGSGTGLAESFFNVTNTSTHKIQFEVTSIASGSKLSGNTGYSLTYFTFIRLGDSQ
jgi:hypothetical protein